jgi:CDP-diacylglycerol---glycerol-3-phosphate 3-phosphatidyltransferase
MSNASNVIWNVPNILTMVRLVLSLIMFACLPWRMGSTTLAAFVLFVIAAGTDWIDGYWARRFNQITKLGRILDPFADKMLICGAYILLAAEQTAAGQTFGTTGWMAVIVMGREMLVTGLRSFIEQAGGDFSAKWSGKWKMVFQCAAVGAGLVALYLHQQSKAIPAWLPQFSVAANWLAVLITLYSGAEYILAAMKMLRASSAS